MDIRCWVGHDLVCVYLNIQAQDITRFRIRERKGRLQHYEGQALKTALKASFQKVLMSFQKHALMALRKQFGRVYLYPRTFKKICDPLTPCIIWHFFLLKRGVVYWKVLAWGSMDYKASNGRPTCVSLILRVIWWCSKIVFWCVFFTEFQKIEILSIWTLLRAHIAAQPFCITFQSTIMKISHSSTKIVSK